MQIDGSLRSLLQSVSKALQAGRPSDAVHLFVKALAHDRSFHQGDRPIQLAKALGKMRFLALVRAFADHPCMACENGVHECDACNGRGAFDDWRICDSCVGIGTSDCEFCAGSGWITYNYVPDSLRPAVAVVRSKRTLTEARRLLATPLPGNAARDPAVARRALVQRLLQLNRLMGAVNNALDAARDATKTGRSAEHALRGVEAACLKLAIRLDRAARQVLLGLKESWRLEATRTGTAEKRRLCERRVAYYASLVRSRHFRGTSLFHPVLFEIHRRRTTR